MAMAGTAFIRLLVVFLSFSQLICLNAIPSTRSRSLELKSHESYRTSEDIPMAKMVKNWDVQTIIRRMVVELNDYPGSGANNRHTPRPQLGRGCIDC